MYCSQCGKEIIDDAAFCPYCGAPVKAAPQQMAQPQPQPQPDTTTQNRARYTAPDPNPASGGKVKIRTAFGYPLLVVFVYLLCIIFLPIYAADTSVYLLIIIGIDVAFAAVLAILFFMERKRTGASETCHPLKLGLFGWLCLLVLFFMMFWTSECVANFILLAGEDTNAYVTYEGSELLLYDILSVTIAPVAEELIFRWMCFHSFRKRWSFWPSVILSAFLFTIAHGTLMHIPVTITLSLFNCILYEETGQLRWCIISHMLFNLTGATIVIYLGSTVPMTILWVLTIVFMIFLWQFRDFFFNKVFKLGRVAIFKT